MSECRLTSLPRTSRYILARTPGKVCHPRTAPWFTTPTAASTSHATRVAVDTSMAADSIQLQAGAQADKMLAMRVASAPGNSTWSSSALPALLSAVERDDAPGLTSLVLAQGADPSHRDARGRTPLHHACLQLRPTAVAMLLTLGAHADALDSEGATPLQLLPWAAAASHADLSRIVAALIAAGARTHCYAAVDILAPPPEPRLIRQTPQKTRIETLHARAVSFTSTTTPAKSSATAPNGTTSFFTADSPARTLVRTPARTPAHKLARTPAGSRSSVSAWALAPVTGRRLYSATDAHVARAAANADGPYTAARSGALSRWGETVLLEAVTATPAAPALVQLLLEGGADPNCCGAGAGGAGGGVSGDSALHAAVRAFCHDLRLLWPLSLPFGPFEAFAPMGVSNATRGTGPRPPAVFTIVFGDLAAQAGLLPRPAADAAPLPTFETVGAATDRGLASSLAGAGSGGTGWCRENAGGTACLSSDWDGVRAVCVSTAARVDASVLRIVRARAEVVLAIVLSGGEPLVENSLGETVYDLVTFERELTVLQYCVDLNAAYYQHLVKKAVHALEDVLPSSLHSLVLAYIV